MTRLNIFISLLVISSAANAGTCNSNSELLGAKYEVSSNNKLTKTKSTREVSLWRNHKQVAHQHADSQITEIWEQTPNGMLKLTRHFDAHHRGIEYDPYDVNEGKGETDWSSKFQLISQQLKDQMELKKSKGEGCERIEKYKLKLKNAKFELEWLPEQQLVKSYSETSATGKVRWKLEETIGDPARVKQVFAMRSDYKTTDYADIGDNESDPFLLNMMNLGFIEHSSSGFYDAEGHDIGQHHYH